MTHYFEPFHGQTFSTEKQYAICIGSGRFLRAVFVPVVVELGQEVIIAQTRGESFVNAVTHDKGVYAVDTVQRDGSITTNEFRVAAVGSLGNAKGRAEFLQLPSKIKRISVIGLGVTESGIFKESQALHDLAEFLYNCYKHLPENQLSVINTDNVPENGTKIHECILHGNFVHGLSDKPAFTKWLEQKVVFHNTMVDRIVAARPTDNNVPYAEPLPKKALVIEDVGHFLSNNWGKCPGVILRRETGQIEVDHLLKLRIANGIHTAMVYVMALSKMNRTTKCIEETIILDYIEILYRSVIEKGLQAKGVEKSYSEEAYADWIHRLTHPHFGMDCFFVCQNATLKLGIRVLSSVLANLQGHPNDTPNATVAFAVASALRFITPYESAKQIDKSRGAVFVGKLDSTAKPKKTSDTNLEWEYTTGLHANFRTGIYQFRDPNEKIPIVLEGLARHHPHDSKRIREEIVKILGSIDYVDMTLHGYKALGEKVADLYEQMINGSSLMDLLKQIVSTEKHHGLLKSENAIRSTVKTLVEEVRVVDVHTHLFPPNHGTLMLWGIDELLTYHYLVAEYFITAPASITPEKFFAMDKKVQADLVWDGLFIRRSPISEACRGVITTLTELGLAKLVEARNLEGIREWFATQTPEGYLEKVFAVAKIRYVLTTNIPFEKKETVHWYPKAKEFDRSKFHTGLRVDQLLTGNWESIKAALDEMQIEHSIEGVKELIEKWIKIMQPAYFMASVPPTLEYPTDEELASYSPTTINAATLLRRVLLPLAEKHRLPIAFKFDSVRPINGALRDGGDGVVTSKVSTLQKLCLNYPRVKFLATFLSRVNQHELCVLANKFGNLHIYGCWWYCNNPSIVEEITRIRVELLGTAFTAQHSDARVLDQLIYKWKHSKEVIGTVLQDMYVKLFLAGWSLTREEIQRDVERLFGGAYEEFMQK